MNAKIGKRIGTVLMAALITAALVPAAAEAACRGGKGGGMNCGMNGGRGGGFGIWQNQQAVQDLGLSADQVKQLKEAELASRERLLPLMNELDSLRLKMDQAFAADPVDEKAVLDLTEKLSAVKGKIAVQRTEERLVMSKILSPEQVDKMKSLRGAGCNGKKGGNQPCPMNGGKPCNGGGRGMGQGMGAGNAQN